MDPHPDDPAGQREPFISVAGYLLAAAAFIGIGIAFPYPVLGWPVGLVMTFFGPWGIEVVLRALRR
jgi:hypothetical protein